MQVSVRHFGSCFAFGAFFRKFVCCCCQAVSDLILNSSNPVVKSVVDNAGLAVAAVNKLGDSYSPLQLMVITAGSTYILNSIWNYYKDIDEGWSSSGHSQHFQLTSLS